MSQIPLAMSNLLCILSRITLLHTHLQPLVRNITTMCAQPDITAYLVGTPNGTKISVTLEELGIPYKVRELAFSANEQKSDWFLKVNPNGRIPAITDHSRNNFNVFESGAIMLYLVEHYDPENKLWPKDSDARSEVTQWLMFQMAGVGPMQGQSNHFFRYAPEKIPYGIKRYQDETRRLYTVIENHLAQGREYLAANQFTIADIASFTWIRLHDWAGVSIDGLPHLSAWLERIEARPAVQRGLNVPKPDSLQKMKNSSKEELEEKAKETSAWIMKGQEEAK